jgi:hypothetical protein
MKLKFSINKVKNAPIITSNGELDRPIKEQNKLTFIILIYTCKSKITFMDKIANNAYLKKKKKIGTFIITWTPYSCMYLNFKF